MHRKVEGLEWVKRLEGRPKSIPVGRPKGAKAAGIRYEKALARFLPQAKHGLWFQFKDKNGLGHCQPDLLLRLPGGALVVLEAKYTWTWKGQKQLAELYVPILSMIDKRPPLTVVVCKVLIPEARGRICSSLDEALTWAGRGPVIWHWIGE